MTMLGSPPTAPTGAALVRFVDALEALLDDAGGANAWALTPAELQDLLPRLTRSRARLAEVELRVLREADRQSVGDDVGATNTPAWWAHATGQRVPAARAAARLAERLDEGHDVTRAALAAGRVQVAQARVIIDAVEALPDDLGPVLVADAEAHLVALADLDGESRLDPKALRIAGRKILEVVAPDLAEQHEQKALEAEEREAAASAYFQLRADGHGSMYGRFKIPVLQGEILVKHLAAIAAPRHRRAVDGADTPEEKCRDRCGWGALLDTGETISPAQARRLACEAGIIPAVLGSPSQPLDLGRKARFHTEPQRIATMLRDGGCATVGCDWPPGMCHVHHKRPWSKGGGTSVDDAVMLCPRHHTLAHDSRYQMKTGKSGKVAFSRRT